ncbi:MAG: hypothetical protein IJR87_09000 [Bacteroidaceae bacterium]|nr:hypothetical protein [Bacteroidaceae bacterium]
MDIFEGFGEHKLTKLLGKMPDKAIPDGQTSPDIKWNFTKFVIDRKGNVVARFEPTTVVAEVKSCIVFPAVN